MEMRNLPFTYANKEVSLLDILNGVLDKGVVVQGNLIISIANIDLVYIDLFIVATSVETAIANNMIKSSSPNLLFQGRTQKDGRIPP